MTFSIERSLAILERTPATITQLLSGIPEEWVMQHEGDNTFSPYDVVGHLIHGEKTDWIQRMEIILSVSTDKTFQPYDRFAQYTESQGKSLTNLLEEFTALRKKNIAILLSKDITDSLLLKTGMHPVLGTVTLKELLTTWVVHDLSHIGQIVRTMSKQYKEEVGPWVNFLPILTR